MPLLTPRVFDLDKGYYWRGRNKASEGKPQGVKHFCAIGDIYAIQLIQEYVRYDPRYNPSKHSGNNPYKDFKPFYSFELNLVLRTAKRCNVIDHSDVYALRADAEKLGKFLNVPVWDGTVI